MESKEKQCDFGKVLKLKKLVNMQQKAPPSVSVTPGQDVLFLVALVLYPDSSKFSRGATGLPHAVLGSLFILFILAISELRHKEVRGLAQSQGWGCSVIFLLLCDQQQYK